MKKNLLLLIASAFLIGILPACHKSSGGGSSEATLAVTLTPPNGSTQAAAVGPFSVVVAVTSALPPGGVKIDVSAKVDGSSAAPYFTTTLTSTAATTTIPITNTPSGKVCLVNVTVTSASTSSNVWTGSYRYSGK